VASRAVTVLGAGVAGMVAALLLARDGHRVALVERDSLDVGSPEDAPTWRRKGIPHFLQPHAVIPRGRLELAAHLPDVHAALLGAGAAEVDLRPKLPGPPEPGDEVLRYLAVRRPLIEWALRRAVADEPGVEVHDGVRIDGLVIDARRVAGVRIGGTAVRADVVVDALGRRTPTPGWLDAAGLGAGEDRSSDCGVVYYSRYYRVRPGHDLPDGPWLLSPRGDLGYLGFASFPGDNGAFAALLATPTGTPEWRVLREPAAFEAAVARIPALRLWVDPERVDPITGVMPMAGLRNSLRAYRPSAQVGLVPVGDAYGHTDPVLAHGLAFAVIHAAALVAALRAHADVGDAGAAYAAATEDELRERYEFATALDEQRLRMWSGRPVDPTRHDGDYALFSMAAAGVAAMVDADVFRTFVRRIGLLDRTGALDSDLELQLRIETLFGAIRAMPRPPAGPPRAELLAAVTAAAGTPVA
jgi:2-polyprenyl-6-methoxyphenol hydroxylase-like FAD-dependent oxidoreductase